MFALRGVILISFQFWLLSGLQAAVSPNVALLGTATQSSTYSFGVASLAISGDRGSNYPSRHCSHTQLSSGPLHWWSLLLPDFYTIREIAITNRNEVGWRLNNAEILIGNSLENNGNDNPRCAVISSIPNGATRTFNCRGMMGRLINVKLESPDPEVVLTICELEAYGELAPRWPSFHATVMGRGVEVVEKEMCWSDALLYCRDFGWDLLSVRSEAEQRAVEAVLRSASFPVTKHVWFGLRRSLMSDKWFWMTGETEDFAYFDAKPFWGDTSPCGGIDTGERFYWRDLPCDEHVYFICLKDVLGVKKRVDFYSSRRP